MSRRSLGLRWWLPLLGLPLLLCAGAAFIAWKWIDRPLPLAAPTAELSIELGATPRDVAQAWVAAGVMTSPDFLYAWFRWSGQARRIRAGSYEIETGITPRRLLAKMVQGDEALEQVRFIEGWTLRQLRAALAQAPHLKPATAGMDEAPLMAALGAPGQAGRRALFPRHLPLQPRGQRPHGAQARAPQHAAAPG